MKLLWVTNVPIGAMSFRLYNKGSGNGWMEIMLKQFESADDFQLTVVTTNKVSEILCFQENGVDYWCLPDQPPILYNCNKSSNKNAWRELLNKVKPDIIQIWGTEFTHGLACLREAKGIHAVVYMQGLLEPIARYYEAGIPHTELKKLHTFRDIVKRDSILQQQKKFYRDSKNEQEILTLAKNFICENSWCSTHVKSAVPDACEYRCPLSINPVFSQNEWDISKCRRHSIICTASGYPLKGLHMTLRAVKLLKRKYPDVRLYVPGEKQVSDSGLESKIRKPGYKKYIEKLIDELGISENIIWLNPLTQEQLAAEVSKSHVFALCSALENHSSSLKEAMLSGVPCVAADVGGVPEYVGHGENALLYRFEEYEMLAKYISDIFDDDELAKKLSRNGRESQLTLHDDTMIFNTMCDIYKKILEGKR